MPPMENLPQNTPMTDQVIENKKEHSWDEHIRTILFAIVLAVLFRSFAYEPFHIPSGSMKSNLLVGDYLFVSKYSYGYSRYSFPFGFRIFDGRIPAGKPQRGDVVVFRLPANPRIDFIKRVMGLPGDHIQVKEGIVYINGVALKRQPIEDYIDDEFKNNVHPVPRLLETLPEGKQIRILKERKFGPADDTPVYTVPPAHYFMMGDNRDNSRDSRFMDEVGFVPEENLVGKAQLIFCSVDGGGSCFNPMNWFGKMRYDRFFQSID